MVNSKFSFYLVYFKAAIYVFINFLLFRLRSWEGLGGGKPFCFMISFFFFNSKLKEYFADAFLCQRWVKHEPGEKKTNMPSKALPALLLQRTAPFPHFPLLEWFFFTSRFLFKTSVCQSQLSFGAETFTYSIVHRVLSVELQQCFKHLENF